MKFIIGLVGRKGCGKGTIAKILAEKYGAKVFRFSSVIADLLRRLALPESHDNMIRLSEVLRHEFGEDVLKNAIMAQIERGDGNLLVLDGLRRIEDLEGFETLGTFRVINVTAPIGIRYQRLTHRGEKIGENEMSFDEFVKMQADAPTERTIADVEARAWKTIENAGTLADLERAVQAVMEEIQR